MDTQIVYTHTDLSKAQVYDPLAAASCSFSNFPSDLATPLSLPWQERNFAKLNCDVQQDGERDKR